MVNGEYDELREFKSLVDKSAVLFYRIMDSSLLGEDIPVALMNELVTSEHVGLGIKRQWHEILSARYSNPLFAGLLETAAYACKENEFRYLVSDLGIYYKTSIQDAGIYVTLLREKAAIEVHLETGFMGSNNNFLPSELTESLANLILITRHKDLVFEAVEQVKAAQHAYDAYARLGEPLKALNALLEKMIHV